MDLKVAATEIDKVIVNCISKVYPIDSPLQHERY